MPLPVSHPTLLSVGTAVPDFRLLDQRGYSLGLSDGMGEHGLILLFYSSFWLPGDLSLLKTYAQAYPELQKAGLGVMAVSGINWETQHHLAQRLQCPFPLLFDPCCRVSKAYRTMLVPKFVTGRAIYGLDPQYRVTLASKKTSPQDAMTTFS